MGHRSRRLTRELLADARLAVAMSPAHLAAIRHLEPDVEAALVTDYLAAGDRRRGSSVPDPFGGDAGQYEEVAAVLESCVDGLLERVSEGS